MSETRREAAAQLRHARLPGRAGSGRGVYKRHDLATKRRWCSKGIGDNSFLVEYSFESPAHGQYRGANGVKKSKASFSVPAVE